MKFFIFLTVVLSLSSLSHAAGGYGLTYGPINLSLENGLEIAGCFLDVHTKLDRPHFNITRNESECNIYQGDSHCSKYYPILCIRRLNITWFFEGIFQSPDMHWSGSYFAITIPVLGSSLKNLSMMNSYCENQFGSQWSAYELTKTGFQSYISGLGYLGESRLWVANSFDKSNCWD